MRKHLKHNIVTSLNKKTILEYYFLESEASDTEGM